MVSDMYFNTLICPLSHYRAPTEGIRVKVDANILILHDKNALFAKKEQPRQLFQDHKKKNSTTWRQKTNDTADKAAARHNESPKKQKHRKAQAHLSNSKKSTTFVE
jgi:hypothetical protein